MQRFAEFRQLAERSIDPLGSAVTLVIIALTDFWLLLIVIFVVFK